MMLYYDKKDCLEFGIEHSNKSALRSMYAPAASPSDTNFTNCLPPKETFATQYAVNIKTVRIQRQHTLIG